ncbi:uncharacterized protein LOC131246553 [Magnolia sinica]|uniref:uncharacterized protein LOC131246553 n=1 Tax=Magnolia sinica TaxID=86752 RepID=UPI00265AB594|nr:uncharacterized protein LOC131246553 [Magnolia sinica]
MILEPGCPFSKPFRDRENHPIKVIFRRHRQSKVLMLPVSLAVSSTASLAEHLLAWHGGLSFEALPSVSCIFCKVRTEENYCYPGNFFSTESFIGVSVVFLPSCINR